MKVEPSPTVDFTSTRPSCARAIRRTAGSPNPVPPVLVVKKGLKIRDFNIENAIPRLKEHGDIFKGVLGKPSDILKAAKKLKQ